VKGIEEAYVAIPSSLNSTVSRFSCAQVLAESNELGQIRSELRAAGSSMSKKAPQRFSCLLDLEGERKRRLHHIKEARTTWPIGCGKW
jgi:hypothetical protein